ncbi:MAG: hypothetical protein ACMUJM_16550 [bacterium]
MSFKSARAIILIFFLFLVTTIKLTGAQECIIEEVSVTDVDRATHKTIIQIKFDKSMAGADVIDPNSYSVKYVPGLKENDVIGGTAQLNADDITYNDANFIATLAVDGVIESTAEEHLPQVSIRKDIVGGSPPVLLHYQDKGAHVSLDKVGPYLKSASFSYNPEHGKSVEELIKEEKLTLTLFFSEAVVSPERLDSTAFIAHGGWNISCIKRGKHSPCNGVAYGVWEIAITLDSREALNNGPLPYMSPKFDEGPTLSITPSSKDRIKDAQENWASDPEYQIPIHDATAVWLREARTVDSILEPAGLEGVVDHIILTFGKDMAITTNTFDRENKVIWIDGDPNIVKEVTHTTETTIEIELYEMIDQVERDMNTAWTPIVSFDLDEDEAILIRDNTPQGESPLVDDFSIIAEDGAAPILVNRITYNDVTSDYIKTYTLGTEIIGGQTYYEEAIILEFSEPMDPNIWKKPYYVDLFFEKDFDPNIRILTFLTDDSSPRSTSSLRCGGNKIVVLVETAGDVPSVCDIYYVNTTMKIKFHEKNRFYDLNGNKTSLRVLSLIKVFLCCCGWWGYCPRPFPPLWPDPMIMSSKVMRIYGSIYTNPNDTPMDAGIVSAFHRDELFHIDPNGHFGQFVIDPYRNYGVCRINDDGSYYIKVYGKDTMNNDSQKGFEFGDPVILVVCPDPTAANPVYEIATTACLTNADYSIPFDGGPTKLPVKKDLYLGQREIIKLHPGWNLISTSISGTYVDYTLCNLLGIDPAKYQGYFYGPDDDCNGKGSLPKEEEIYVLDNTNDLSSVLFTLSHPYFSGHLFYDPATIPIYPVQDRLSDTLNSTPVFCAGRGYYIYIEDANCPPGVESHEWQIVLFGKKIPGPEYKLKLDQNPDLIGHWGGLLYYHPEEDYEVIRMIKELLPIPTYRDDLCTANIGGDTLTIIDIHNEPQSISVISTYCNYGARLFNSTASWYADLPSYNDLSFIAPGGGYWLLINTDTRPGPFFANYMGKNH